MWRRVASATLVLFGLVAGSASAQQPPGPNGEGTDHFVTFAARVCDLYTDISANKARNNIQESLKDLGPDTNYPPGELVNPDRELAGQPKCRPLSNWRFTLGTGIAGIKVTGPWGSLSVVSGAYATDIVTLASIQDRDKHGHIIGRTIEGATTVELTQGQLDKAAGHNLWLQGGTTTDPVLNAQFPNQFGFGALRCATDNVNGDNVEYIAFPDNVEHVYCFAYYVRPPPTSGTIIVTKHVSDPPKANQTFTFEGNVSYTGDHRFPLEVKNGADASATFFRAATAPGDPLWTVAEIVPAGWRLTGLACTSERGSVSTRNPARPEQVSISLVAGDTVRCTFTDALIPPPGRLLLTKLTTGGVGTFPFAVSELGGQSLVTTSATTTAPGVVAPAKANPIALDPGTYLVAEDLPSASDGRWVQVAAGCQAEAPPSHGRRASLRVDISSSQGQVCQFENRFIPDGRITILKTTLGGTGTTGFIVTPVDDPATQYLQTATTTDETPTLARGDSTRNLPLGRYLIQETGTVSNADEEWSLTSVTCGGLLKAFEQGEVVVELTADNPTRVCRFVNQASSVTPPEPPEPPVPPTPGPSPLPPAIDPGTPGAPQPELVVTKRALRSTVRVGSTVTYAITVRNAGPVPAEEVFVADAPGRRGQLVSARASQADCDELVPMHCRVGTLGAGEQVTIRVRLRATDTGLLRNLAVAGSGTDEGRLANNIALARVRVRPAGQVIACPSGGPRARAAC
jgi:hypothetical protein